MSGPEDNMKDAWKEIVSVIHIEELEPVCLYLGCLHKESVVKGDDEVERRVMKSHQESFSKDKIHHYSEEIQKATGSRSILTQVSTPYPEEQIYQPTRLESQKI